MATTGATENFYHRVNESNIDMLNRIYFNDKKYSYNHELILNNIGNGNVIVKKDRITGLTSFLAAIIAIKLINEKNVNVIYIGNDQMNNSFKNKILDIIISEHKYETLSKNCSSTILLKNSNNISFIGKSLDISKNFINKNTWVIFDEINLLPNKSLIFDKFLHFSENITLISSNNSIDNVFFPIFFLGEKAGFKRLIIKYQNSEDEIIKTVLQKSDFISEKQFCKLFGGEYFYDSENNLQNIDFLSLVDKISKYKLSDENISFLDVIDFFECEKIKII